MATIDVTKSETVVYGGEFDHRELAELLGLDAGLVSAEGVAEYIEGTDGDLSALNDAIAGSRDCVRSTWTVVVTG